VLGGILPGHPFDVVYNYGLRHWIKGPRLPRYPAPRHFACVLASLFIIAAALSFQTGAVLTGQVIAGVLIVTAMVPITTGFCVPSFLYRLITGKISFNWTIEA
jgi:antibiotic biosynthesis monooxygenase (ABM) superfamily enzyme